MQPGHALRVVGQHVASRAKPPVGHAWQPNVRSWTGSASARQNCARKLAFFAMAMRVVKSHFDMVFVGQTRRLEMLHFYFHGLSNCPIHENNYFIFTKCFPVPQKPYRNVFSSQQVKVWKVQVCTPRSDTRRAEVGRGRQEHALPPSGRFSVGPVARRTVNLAGLSIPFSLSNPWAITDFTTECLANLTLLGDGRAQCVGRKHVRCDMGMAGHKLR